jgi:hypothetical protein
VSETERSWNRALGSLVLSLAAASGLSFGVALAAGAGCSSSSTSHVVSPGGEAQQFLEPSPFSQMKIEVIPVTGRDPDPNALEIMLQRAREHCHKPDGISLDVDTDVAPAIASGVAQYTTQELQSFQGEHRQRFTGGSTIVLNVVYSDGVAAFGPNTLGATIGADLIVIFKDRIRALDPTLEGQAESSVLVHELGHALGLVNQPNRMVTPHEDEQHPGHCNNPLCVMFWELEASLPSASPSTSPMPSPSPSPSPSSSEPSPSPTASPTPGAVFPLDYDANCKADLAAAGGQ